MPVEKETKEVRDPAALELFKSIGLDAKTAQNAVANSKVTANLTDVVLEVCQYFLSRGGLIVCTRHSQPFQRVLK